MNSGPLVVGTGITRRFGATTALDGVDTLISVERLRFADVVRAFDTTPGGNSYGAMAMLNAAFNAVPNTDLLSRWTAQLDQLGNLRDLAQAMINDYAPGVSNADLVAHLWGTIIETQPSPRDLADVIALIDNGTFTQASLVEFVATHPLNTEEIVHLVGQPVMLDPTYFAMPGA